jgi:hypothetical protein
MNSFFTGSIIALWLVALFLAFASIGLYRDIRGVLAGRELQVGAAAPNFSLVDLRLRRRVAANFSGGKLTVLLFLKSDSSSHAVSSRLATEYNRKVDLILICCGQDDLCYRLFSGSPPAWIVGYDLAGRVADVYGVMRFPTAVLIRDNTIASAYIYPASSRKLMRAQKCLRVE